jgi:hypothetical protein
MSNLVSVTFTMPLDQFPKETDEDTILALPFTNNFGEEQIGKITSAQKTQAGWVIDAVISYEMLEVSKKGQIGFTTKDERLISLSLLLPKKADPTSDTDTFEYHMGQAISKAPDTAILRTLVKLFPDITKEKCGGTAQDFERFIDFLEGQ